MTTFLFVFAIYSLESQAPAYKYVSQLNAIIYICILQEPLLQQYCIDTRLYLQHDLTITQLAKAVGTNRFYLSQYFSHQGITYNTYINGLRIQHFMRLYQKAVATHRSISAKQLAFDSGYRNYTTFSAVFKRLKGQTVTEWMRNTGE